MSGGGGLEATRTSGDPLLWTVLLFELSGPRGALLTPFYARGWDHIVVLPALEAYIRHMFENVKPFDWLMLVIEAAVLIVIVYEVVIEGVRRRAEAKRRAFIDAQALALSVLWDKGRRIQSVVPDPLLITDTRIITDWIAEVEAWTQETQSFLAVSPRASASFLSVTDAGKVNLNIPVPGRIISLTGPPQAPYQRLVVQLENLRRIIDRPDAYF
jgi:hypothetical protein